MMTERLMMIWLLPSISVMTSNIGSNMVILCLLEWEQLLEKPMRSLLEIRFLQVILFGTN